jgi:chitodextrinase
MAMFSKKAHATIAKLLIFSMIITFLLPLRVFATDGQNVESTSELSLDWNVQYQPYRSVLGQVVSDPLGDQGKQTESMFDLVSNGDSAAASYAFKNDQVYFRMNLKADPRNSFAGGFDNKFRAIVQIRKESGEIVGAVGLNGSDPETDYVYVASYDSQLKTIDVLKLYEFPFSAESAQNAVRVVSDKATDSFVLEMQVPVYDIVNQTGIDVENEQLKFVFGTSMRGNLVEITKDSILNGSATTSSLAPITLQDKMLRLETNLVDIISGSNPPIVDQEQEYVIEYKLTNNGLSPLKNIEVSDALNQDVEIVDLSDPELELLTSDFIWRIAQLGSLETKTKRLTVKFTPQSYQEGQAIVLSEFAYATIVGEEDVTYEAIADVATKNVLWQRMITIGSDVSQLSSVVVSTNAPIIRGVSDATNGEKVKITLTSDTINQVYDSEVIDGMWQLDLKKANAPLLVNNKEYLLTVSIGASSVEQTIRYLSSASEYVFRFRDDYDNSTDAYVLTNDSSYVIRGWTTAPIGTFVTTSDGNIIEVEDDPSSDLLNMWQFTIDLNDYSDGTYLFDAYLEGQSSSDETIPTVYANLLLKLDRTLPEIEAQNEDYFNLFTDRPLIKGFVSEADVKLEAILDLNGDGNFANGTPDVKYTPLLVGNEWQMKINQALPRGEVTQIQLTATDAAGNSNQFYMALQPSADIPFSNVEMPSQNVFTTNDVVINGTTSVEASEMLVLKVTDRSTDETFNYYTVVDSEQKFSFSLLNYDIAGDYLKDGEYLYQIQYVNPKFADLQSSGTFKVQIDKPQFVMKNEVKRLNIENKTLGIDGMITAEDMELFIGADVTLMLTNSSNDSIGEQFHTKIDEAGAFLFGENVTLPSGNYKVSLELTDRAFNLFSHAPSTISVDIDVLAPTTPTGVLQQAVAKDSASIRWNASTDNRGIKHYEIYVNGELKQTVNSLNHTLTGLAEFTEYVIQIAAADVSGNTSPKSNGIKIKTLDRTAPTVPDGLKSSAVTESGFRMEWNPSNDNGGSGVTAYEVYLDGVLQSANVSTPSYQFSGLKPSTSYKLTVKAKDAVGNTSALSQPLTINTAKDAMPPSKPESVVMSNLKADRFTVNWKASTDNVKVVGYELYLDNKLFMKIQGETTVQAIVGLKNFTKYAVKIRALDAAGNSSAFSSEVSVTTADSVKPSVPTGLKIVDVNAMNMRISWNAAKDESGIASYEVFADGVRLASTAKLTLDTKIPLKASVNYQVLAVDRFGNKSALSTAVTYKRKPLLEVRGKQVIVNGAPLKLPTNATPILRNGTMMIPYKQVFDAIALKSSYNTSSKTVTATRSGYALTFTLNSRNYRANKIAKTMTVAPTQINGVVMLPAQFFETELGMRYAYSAK